MANRFGQIEPTVHNQIVFVDYKFSVINLSNKKHSRKKSNDQQMAL